MGTIKIDGYEIGPDEAFPDLVHLTRRGDNSEALYVPLNVGAAAAIWEHMETHYGTILRRRYDDDEDEPKGRGPCC